ncbi:RNA binding (RRM/RBD/RNP motifs) family protein [Thalictrum thalictroides]|uniref:RNA binding (RRM/RBD/RNP motifs) family protein n=1 Tax=Thalictrum thalictroides TaxID=46969 RepID=A0A7J6W4Q0_THATH|nr:RNA binding (RRM/RBD/RNP motifs) family protein [Thalictrum thalictroides]
MEEDLDRGDDLTFRVNFTNDGATKLRERVRDKLKEFMGDYTDDTLVEYVIVLLRNGRRKDEARNELNVFLGDDTDSFVSWLWDHLSLHLQLYVPQQEAYSEELVETNSALGHKSERSDSPQLDSESERDMSVKESKSRRNREWKGLVRDVAEPPPLRSSEIEHLHSEKKTQKKLKRGKRYSSPQPPVRVKRSRHDERQQTKRDVPPHPSIDAPRRLLQFAVRDAVGTTRVPSSRTNPTLKRLRSVVSTSTGDSYLDDPPQRVRSVARLPSAVTTAFKAAAEAAADVTKLRGPVNVFDRLGHGLEVSGVTKLSELKANTLEDAEYEHSEHMVEDTHSNYIERNENIDEFAGNTVMLDRNLGTSYDSASDNEGYDDVDVGHRVTNASQTGTSYGHKDDSLMVQYSVAKNTNDIPRTRVKDQNLSANGATASRKIVNISVNVNTWKPPHYQTSQDAMELKNLEAVQEIDAGSKAGTRLTKEINKRVMNVNENDNDMQNESQRTIPSAPNSYSTGRPLEDADSRTIFVNNVHFAATKDTLSRHFNKFGEVLKVVIVTDAATGQPTGSAYIEFMRKGAAELALSLNGTSFMSRILKVVRKGSAYLEASNMVTWPHVARASPFAARLARAPFPRGLSTAFRARAPIKPGPRSLQWKRDATSAPPVEGSVNVSNGVSLSSNSVPLPSPRSLTYVRKDT